MRSVGLWWLLVAAVVARCAARPTTTDVKENVDGLPKIEQAIVIEVAPGETAVLQCPSNDEQHRFQFWWMKPDQIIGPGTALNSDKFKYEVLTGTLYIKVSAMSSTRR